MPRWLNPQHWPTGVYVSLAAAMVISASALTVYFSTYYQPKAKPVDRFAGRNFTYIPFDLNDAIDVCEDKSKLNLGNELVRTQTDWHSSRFEERRQEYLVTLFAHVGTLQVYKNAYIYCHVDPADYVVTYFRVVGLKKQSVFTKDTFKEIFKIF